MIGCDEQPGKGIELQGTGYLSGKSVPSWFPLLGLPPRLETSLLNIALGCLASHSPPLSQTLPAAACMLFSIHLPALLKIYVQLQ